MYPRGVAVWLSPRAKCPVAQSDLRRYFDAAAAGILLVGLMAGRSWAQGSPILNIITPWAGVNGPPGLVLTFDRPPPLFSVIGDGSNQPVVAFAGAVEAHGLAPPSALKGLAKAVLVEPGDGVLSVSFNEAQPPHVVAKPFGPHSVLVTVVGAAVMGDVDASGSPSVQLDPNEDGFEVVPLRYADVSEVVGLLTGERGIKPNDTFTPQEPAFGSAAMAGAGASPPVGAVGGNIAGSDSEPPMVGQTIDPTIGIDRRLNAVILRGPPALIARLKAKIAKLDRPITSVLLETVFVELTETGAKNVGLDLNNANNQIATAEAGQALFERGFVYAPDYVINGGGITNVAAEIRALDRGEAFDPAWVETKLARLMQTLDEVFDRSVQERRPTHAVADEMARARLIQGRA